MARRWLCDLWVRGPADTAAAASNYPPLHKGKSSGLHVSAGDSLPEPRRTEKTLPIAPHCFTELASCSDTLGADIGSGQYFTGFETREICSRVGHPYRCQCRKCCSSAIPPPPPSPRLLFCLRCCSEFSMIQSAGTMPPVGPARKFASRLGRAACTSHGPRLSCR